MTGFTDFGCRDIAEHIISTYPYVALFTTIGLDDGTSFVEVSGGSYVRHPTGSGDWGPVSGTSPTTLVNQVAFSFPTPTADWGTIYGWGLVDAPTSGHIGVADYLGASPWIPASVSQASPALITAARNHGYIVDDQLVFALEYGGTVPTFSQSSLITGVLRAAHVTTDTVDVTNGGVQVNTSSTGSGMIRKVSPQAVLSGQSPILFPAGSLTLSFA